MRSVLSFTIAVSGWFLTGLYLIYEYKEFGPDFSHHLFTNQSISGVLFHFFILTAPIVSAAFGYLVNERMKLHEEIGELELRYKDYYDKAPYGYHSSAPDKTILEVNDTWLDMLGYQRDEVVGKMKLADLLTEEGRAAIDLEYKKLLLNVQMENVELEFRKKNGALLPVLLSASAVLDRKGRFVRSRTIVKDNTQKKSYELALRAVASEWTRTFDSMPWGVMLLGGDYSIIRANTYISEVTGIPIKEVVRKKCYEVIHGSDRPMAGCLMDRCMRGKSEEVSEYFEPKIGRHFRLYCSPVSVKGETPSFVHSFVDITDIKEGQKQLLDSRDAFFNMLKDASASFRDLKELHNGLILSFANAIDAKSNWTKGHSERVSRYAVALAEEAGLKDKSINTLRVAALLHDIGKIGTYDYLLDKPERLTPEEFEVVKKHPMKSAEILGPIAQFREITEIIKYHHERYDGTGYPFGLGGRDIPLMARILCIADSFDSMTADRPYRAAPGLGYAVEELRRCSGTHFDPEMVEVFLRVLEKDPAPV